MLFCQRCGQCKYLSDDDFFEIRNNWGWEQNAISNDDGEYLDYCNGETTDSEHDHYECPHCQSSDIEFGWDGEEETALALRENYIKAQQERARERHRMIRQMELREKASDPSRKWDINKNVVTEEVS
jgi:hypothetical protein